MEEDIHGRMFEAFLDATIRGKDIGQFFTPRDVVNLMVGIGDPKVTKTHVDKVLDACCGSGGFLISALSGMLSQLKNMKNVSSKEREELDEKLSFIAFSELMREVILYVQNCKNEYVLAWRWWK